MDVGPPGVGVLPCGGVWVDVGVGVGVDVNAVWLGVGVCVAVGARVHVNGNVYAGTCGAYSVGPTNIALRSGLAGFESRTKLASPAAMHSKSTVQTLPENAIPPGAVWSTHSSSSRSPLS